MVDLISVIINLVISVIILSPALWLVGRWLVGKDKAKFTDAIWIVVIGTIVGTIFGYFNLGLVGALIMLIIWLALIKHFFDCGWLKALLIAIVTVVVFIIIGIVLALLGFALLAII
ncbi:MAG: hypothetical protein WHS82_05230 [Candidatus Methanosuratincola sp.]